MWTSGRSPKAVACTGPNLSTSTPDSEIASGTTESHMSRRKRCATLSNTAESYLTVPFPPVRVSCWPIARLYAYYCGPVKEPCRSGYADAREGGPGHRLDGTAPAARPPETGGAGLGMVAAPLREHGKSIHQSFLALGASLAQTALG